MVSSPGETFRYVEAKNKALFVNNVSSTQDYPMRDCISIEYYMIYDFRFTILDFWLVSYGH